MNEEEFLKNFDEEEEEEEEEGDKKKIFVFFVSLSRPKEQQL